MTGEFRLLGEVGASVDGQPIAVRGARQQSILAVLLVEANRPVPADQLIDRVWGTTGLPRQPANALSAHVKLLRRALAPVSGMSIRWQSAGYRLDLDGEAVDLHRFRTLTARARTADEEHAVALFERALGLWRGEPFTGLDTPWLNAVRATLISERHAAQLELTDLQLRCGRHTELLPDLTDRVREHPLDERLAGQLMLGLYRSDRPAEALQHYQRIRARLAEELGTDPGPALRKLHQRILTADPRLTGPGRWPVPRQLPAPPRSFTGRTGELAALDRAAEQGGTMAISALAGAGGIGKTWLALHWAHRNLHRFPDGQLFVDLHGYGPEARPMSAATVLHGFLDALGVQPGRAPADPYAQAALFRSLVAGKRMLVVLDNAADAGQVVPLLPGSPTCTVIVTSRDHLASLITRHGASHLPVDVLSEAEARDLLTAGLGATRLAAESEAGAELLADCAGFPLALSVVVGRTHTHPHQPLATLATELRSARLAALAQDDPAASLPAVLSWSYRALTAEQARVFCLLGVAPGPDISLAAAACLADLTTAQAQVVLRCLVQASLLRQYIPGRYRMHDLIRHYAADRAGQDLPDADRVAALRRVLHFYLHTASTGGRLLEPHRPMITLEPPAPGCHPLPLSNRTAAIGWFDAEHHCLLAALQTAVAQGWHQCVWQLVWAMHPFHWRSRHGTDHLAAWRAGLTAADQLGDPVVQALARRHLGHACGMAGRYEEAMEHLQHALALAGLAGDVPGQGHAHRYLAWAWDRQGDDHRVLEHASRALRVFQALGMPVWEAELLNQVGYSAARLGEHERARTSCEAALALFTRHDHRIGEAATLDSLGFLAHTTGQHARAVDCYRQALTLFRDLGDTYLEADTLDRLGYPHLATGQREQARAVWLEALELYQTQQRSDEAERVRRQLDAAQVQ
ncbi:AfsR/SARP family transcriptional regulator [Kutzneria albida]|uniref:Transcription regulator, SARP family n=1 Tax=Kutzneria albida DSM 43870 TaxID=1449976 RepID=W5W6P2_9PSEU|nr:BTAD domain-containing putative transcriptional regulator [Kutzneria albida]AHH96863.1 transcription regulator, SARP family [Kutzneria albida DSM 43870]